MKTTESLAEAAKIVGGQAALAKLIGVKPPTVHQWLSGNRPVPPARAVEIERATGGKIKKQDLCPSFPWESAA